MLEDFALLGFYAVYGCSCLLAFWDSLSIPFSRIKQSYVSEDPVLHYGISLKFHTDNAFTSSVDIIIIQCADPIYLWAVVGCKLGYVICTYSNVLTSADLLYSLVL
jgi:hypothetical protein